jgi:hypothetical protein
MHKIWKGCAKDMDWIWKGYALNMERICTVLLEASLK